MYRLAEPRTEGPLLRRWRARHTLRRPGLVEAWRAGITRTADPIPETPTPQTLPDMVQGAVFRQDMEWILDWERVAP